MLPVKDGKWFTEMSVGDHMLRYDSLLALTHFKGHTMGGFGGSKNISYINVLRNMSVSCDCERLATAPVTTPNIGIVASTDILAADQASVDLVMALQTSDNKDLVERMTTRHGFRQLSCMKGLGMGNDKYILIDLDNEGQMISTEKAVEGVTPFVG